MTVPDPDVERLRQLSAQLRSEVNASVRTVIQQFATYLALVLRNNPVATLGAILQRSDVQQALVHALASAQVSAQGFVRQAWQQAGGPEDSSYLDSLLSDVRSAYGVAQSQIQSSVARLFRSAQLVSTDVNPRVQRADRRADTVLDALRVLSYRLSVRNGMTISAAVSRADTELQLERASLLASSYGSSVRKTWVADFVNNVPCASCQELHGTTVGVAQPFPVPSVFRGSVYGDMQGPGLHPYCHCRLVCFVGAAPDLVPPPAAVGVQYVTSDEIKALPEARYQLLVSFIEAALKKLAEVVRRLLRLTSVSDSEEMMLTWALSDIEEALAQVGSSEVSSYY